MTYYIELGVDVLRKSFLFSLRREKLEAKDILEEIIGDDGRKILNSLFPENYNELLKLIQDTLDQVSHCRNIISTAFDEYFEGIICNDVKKQRSIIETLIEPSKIIWNFMEKYKNITKNKSFIFAVRVVSRLKDLKQDEDRVLFEVKDERLLIWPYILETIYAENYDLEICELFKLINELEHIGEILRNYGSVLHDLIKDNDREGISQRIYNVMRDLKISLPSSIIDYLTDHMLSLKKLIELDRNGLRRLYIEDFEKYIRKFLCNRGILEYEIYSLLIRNNIASIPSISAYIDQDHFELDIVAMNESEELINVEVTSRQDSASIDSKIKKLSDLYEVFRIPSIIVISEEYCDYVKRCIDEYALENEIKCVSCERPHKIIRTINRLD